MNKPLFRFVAWYFIVNSLVFWLIGFGYLRSIFASSTVFHNSAADFSTCLGTLFVCFFTVLNYLTFMMFLAFIPGLVVFIFALSIPNKRLIWSVSVLAATASVILLMIDSRVYTMFKFHLNSTLLELIFSGQWHGVFDFSQLEMFEIGCLVSVIVVLECCIASLVWKKIIVPKRFMFGKLIAIYWLGGALFCADTLILSISKQNNLFSHQMPVLPLLSQLVHSVLPSQQAKDTLSVYTEQHFAQPMYSNEPLHYPTHPLQCRRPTKPYNVILIGVDSLRADSMRLRYMPNTMKFADKSWQFKHHMSGGNSTQPGLFALFYSLPVNYWTAALRQKKQSVLMALLQKYGYVMRILWGSQYTMPPFDKTIFMGISNDELFAGSENDTGDRDRQVTKHAIEFLTSTHQKPFFLHLFYTGPHGYCEDQSYPAIYKPIQTPCSRILTLNNNTDPRPYYNRYLNAVKFIDNELAQVLGLLEKQGYLKNSVIIITSDHGQEFNDNHHNYWDHAGNYTDTQTRVPFIMHWPNATPRQFNYVTSGYDLVPTLLQRLFACKNPVSDYSIGQNLLQEEGRLPFVLAGSYVNMGIIERQRLTTLYTSGMITITDKHAHLLEAATPDIALMSQALSLMRRYFGA